SKGLKPTKITSFIFVFSFCSLLQTYNYEFNIEEIPNIYDGRISINITENSFYSDTINLDIQLFPNSPDEVKYYVLTFDMKFREDYESDFDGVCIGPTWEKNKPGELKTILSKENNFKSRIDGKLQEESLRDGCNNYMYYLRYFEVVLANDKKILYGVATDYAELYPDAPYYWLLNKNNEIEKIGTTNIKKYSLNFELSK
ncbi:hypothetical protein N9U17_01740, partial [Acidimicrobiaceae bacterium]|nr:hypothetical protein [Acidimicrobiaceae bacterium]